MSVLDDSESILEEYCNNFKSKIYGNAKSIYFDIDSMEHNKIKIILYYYYEQCKDNDNRNDNKIFKLLLFEFKKLLYYNYSEMTLDVMIDKCPEHVISKLIKKLNNENITKLQENLKQIDLNIQETIKRGVWNIFNGYDIQYFNTLLGISMEFFDENSNQMENYKDRFRQFATNNPEVRYDKFDNISYPKVSLYVNSSKDGFEKSEPEQLKEYNDNYLSKMLIKSIDIKTENNQIEDLIINLSYTYENSATDFLKFFKYHIFTNIILNLRSGKYDKQDLIDFYYKLKNDVVITTDEKKNIAIFYDMKYINYLNDKYKNILSKQNILPKQNISTVQRTRSKIPFKNIKIGALTVFGIGAAAAAAKYYKNKSKKSKKQEKTTNTNTSINIVNKYLKYKKKYLLLKTIKKIDN